MASWPTVLFTCNVLAMSILIPLSTVNSSTTLNCQRLIVHVVVIFAGFKVSYMWTVVFTRYSAIIQDLLKPYFDEIWN